MFRGLYDHIGALQQAIGNIVLKHTFEIAPLHYILRIGRLNDVDFGREIH